MDTDEGPRAGTSVEALAKLKPVFAAGGLGNSRELLADQRRIGVCNSDGRKTHESVTAQNPSRDCWDV